jgi:hypothetical protein
MSARYYCDNCGRELRPKEGARLKRRLGRVAVQVIHDIDGIWNGGDVCHDCIIAAVVVGAPFEERTPWERKP